MYLLFSYHKLSVVNASRNFVDKFDTIDYCLLFMDNDRAEMYDIYDIDKNEWYEFREYHGEVRFKRLQDEVWILLHSYIAFSDLVMLQDDDIDSIDFQDPTLFIPASPRSDKRSFLHRLARLFFSVPY